MEALKKSGIKGVSLESDGNDMVVRVSDSFQEYMSFKELLELHKNTDRKVIKLNLRKLLKNNNMKNSELVEILDIGTHSAYGYTNLANKGKPDFMNLMLLSKYFGVEIEEFFREEGDTDGE